MSKVVKQQSIDGSHRRSAQPCDLADRRHWGHHHRSWRAFIRLRYARNRSAEAGAAETVPASVLDALETLKAALRLLCSRDQADAATANAITTILNTVTQAVEAR